MKIVGLLFGVLIALGLIVISKNQIASLITMSVLVICLLAMGKSYAESKE